MRNKTETFSKIQQTFSRRLTELMSENSLNQAKLSKFTGISNQAISNWLLCKGVPSLEMLYILADYFDVSIDDLTGRKDY